MSDRQRLTPPQATMWPSPPRLSLSISSVVSPAAMVVLAHSAVFRVREKTTLRAAFMMPENGWSAVEGAGHGLVSRAAREVRVRALVEVGLLLQGRRVLGQAAT